MSKSELRDVVDALKPYTEEDTQKSWILLLGTFAVMAVLGTAIYLTPLKWVQIVLALILGCVNVRLFIFLHDYLHGAIFRKSQLGGAILSLYGLSILTTPQVWRDSHNYHHAHNSKLIGSSIGSFPLLTVSMYRSITPFQRFGYRAIRSPWNMLLGYVTVFFYGMSVEPLIKNFKRNYTALISIALHVSIILALTYTLGFWLCFVLFILPFAFSCTIGTYLFYIQHNFPGMRLFSRSEWDFFDSSLYSTSYMGGSALIHWLTGSIGYHHVHHLQPRIPFYKLKEAMHSVPILNRAPDTKLNPKEILKCLKLCAWAPEENRMLSYHEVSLKPELQITQNA